MDKSLSGLFGNNEIVRPLGKVLFHTRKISRISYEDKLPIEISTPPEFKGRPGLWTPETLLIASVL